MHPKIKQVSGRPGSGTQRTARTFDRSGLQAKTGVVQTAGQPLVAAPRRFGTRKNVSSSPPSAMKDVDRRAYGHEPDASRSGQPELRHDEVVGRNNSSINDSDMFGRIFRRRDSLYLRLFNQPLLA